MGFANGAALTPLEKDYYNILGIPTSATPEQIKESYRKLAKKYHPDARAAAGDKEYTPDANRFRDVQEAYSVLSIRESRVNYDLTRKKNPDAFKAVSESEFNLEHRRDLRDKTGMIKKDVPKRGSYAEDRHQQLKKDREQYDVNHLGYYNGGLPKKDMGPIRGKSLGNPGEFHSPQWHNYLNYHHQDTSFISQEDALKFKHWMGSDQADYQRSRPYWPMYYDRNMDFMRDRTFWLGFLLLTTFGVWANYKFGQETKRWQMWERREHIHELPGHHYSNRGGVVIQKEFIGFEKYHTSNDSVMNWYKKAYPHQFAHEEESSQH